MNNTTDFPIKPFGQETPDRILKAFNIEGNMEDVVVIGIDSDGYISVASSCKNDIGSIGMLEIAKNDLLDRG